MDEYLGMIKLFVGRYAPDNWLMCQGQSLQISQYQPLFAVLGNVYGGDGVSTFNLPDLRMAVPVGAGAGPNLNPIALAQKGGVNNVTLNAANLPAHTHTANLQASTVVATGSTLAAAQSVLAQPKAFYESTGEPGDAALYAPAPTSGTVAMNSSGAMLSVSTVGVASPAPHTNMQPYIVLNYIMCVNGIFPSPQ